MIKIVKILLIAVVFVLICFPRIFSQDKEVTTTEKSGSGEEFKGKRRKKFQIELYGGYSTLNPADLNSRAVEDEKTENFYYRDRFTFEKGNGTILSYDMKKEGEFEKIKYVIPFGFRIKYFLKKSLALSFGFKYLSKSAISNINYQYSVKENDGQELIYKTEYSPYILSAKGYIPTVGIHLMKKMSSSIGVEGYIAGGPFYAECKFTNTLLEYHYEKGSPDDLLDESYWFVEEIGRGYGFCLNSGARININIGNRTILFLEGGYDFQLGIRLWGPGRTQYDSTTETWSGKWGIKDHSNKRYWGELKLELPSNFWRGPVMNLWKRHFLLNLSGFQVRTGIAFRL